MNFANRNDASDVVHELEVVATFRQAVDELHHLAQHAIGHLETKR